MKTYEAHVPRKSFAFAAIAMTALTLGAAVALPAATGPSERVMQIASAPAPRAQPMRYLEPIEVVAYRERSVSANEGETPRKPQG